MKTSKLNPYKYPCGECQTPHGNKTGTINHERATCHQYNRCPRWRNWFTVEWTIITTVAHMKKGNK